MATLFKEDGEEVYIEVHKLLTEKDVQNYLGGLQVSIYFESQQEFMFVLSNDHPHKHEKNTIPTLILHERFIEKDYKKLRLSPLSIVHGPVLLCDKQELLY